MSFGANSQDQTQKQQSVSQSSSANTSASGNASNSFVLGQQLPFLQSLWGQAQGAANPGAAQGLASQVSGTLGPQLQRSMTALGALGDPRAQIAAQTASLKSGLGALFREEIQPGLAGDAIAAGGLGGGRQGVAQGVAAGQLGQAFTQGLGDIVARANQTALGAQSALPQVASLYSDVTRAPGTAGLDPLTQLAAILGGPTVLNRSTGWGRGSGTSQSTSWSKGKSSGESSGFDFGLGSLFG